MTPDKFTAARLAHSLLCGISPDYLPNGALNTLSAFIADAETLQAEDVRKENEIASAIEKIAALTSQVQQLQAERDGALSQVEQLMHDCHFVADKNVALREALKLFIAMLPSIFDILMPDEIEVFTQAAAILKGSDHG